MSPVGVKPADALCMGTRRAAEMLKLDASVGCAESGKLADIIAVNKCPVDDITEMERVCFVMKGGDIYRWNDRNYRRGM